MKIIIELAGASEAQKTKFTGEALQATLTEIRSAVGDPKAMIETRLPGIGMRLHVVQTFDDFNATPPNAE